MKQTGGYKPSVLRFNKYRVYLSYFYNYIKNSDYKSLFASLRYVLTHQLPRQDYLVDSDMGKYLIRKNTTDFQFINRAYEQRVKEWMMNHLDDFDLFIDAGACIGEYSIWLAKMGKRAIAIEPVNYAALETNVRLNKVEDSVKVYRCGIGNRNERVYFNVLDNVTSSSHVVWDAQQEPNTDINLIDNLRESFGLKPGDRILMKMDLEGMEVEAIQGAAKFIQETEDLKIIYEHFSADEYKNDVALKQLAAFEFSDIDEVNRLAVKTGLISVSRNGSPAVVSGQETKPQFDASIQQK